MLMLVFMNKKEKSFWLGLWLEIRPRRTIINLRLKGLAKNNITLYSKTIEKFRTQLSAGKVMLTLMVILFIRTTYSELMEKHRKCGIKIKKQGSNNDILLQPNNNWSTSKFEYLPFPWFRPKWIFAVNISMSKYFTFLGNIANNKNMFKCVRSFESLIKR